MFFLRWRPTSSSPTGPPPTPRWPSPNRLRFHQQPPVAATAASSVRAHCHAVGGELGIRARDGVPAPFAVAAASLAASLLRRRRLPPPSAERSGLRCRLVRHPARWWPVSVGGGVCAGTASGAPWRVSGSSAGPAPRSRGRAHARGHRDRLVPWFLWRFFSFRDQCRPSPIRRWGMVFALPAKFKWNSVDWDQA